MRILQEVESKSSSWEMVWRVSK